MRAASKPQFLRGNFLQILVWPILCLILGAVLWFWAISNIDADRSAVEKKALKDASDLCHDYAKSLSQVIEQANQITLHLKYNWEQAQGKLNLEVLSRSGIFRYPQIINVVVVNREGIPVTSTVPGRANVSLADRGYFQFHKNDTSEVLQIGKPVMGRLLGKPLIPLSRRLSAADGSFDGIALVSIEPSYFTSFYAGSYPGKTGLLAVVGLDGTLRAAKIGSAIQETRPAVLSVVPLFASSEGALRLAGEPWFSDKLARVVAWQTLKDVPLVVMVGLSEQEYLASHLETSATYRQMAIAGSLALFMFAVTATGLSVRLARKKYQEEEVRRAYRVATEEANEGFYMYDALHDSRGTIVDFKLFDCNERAAQFYGMARTQLIGMKLSDFYPATYFEDLMNIFRQAMAAGFYEDEMRSSRESRLKIEWGKRRLVRSGSGLAVTLLDTTERKLAEEKIEFLAHHDTLTGLPNRVLLRDRFEQAKAITSREKSSMALMFLDADHFKQINDGFGHHVGDQILIQIVKRLHACIRDVDTICRLGGDEFIIVLSNVKNIDDISRIAQSMLDAVSQPMKIEHQPFHTSASIGIAIFPDDGGDFDSLLTRADTAMYQAKDAGRNTYRFYTEQMNIDAFENLRMRNGLRQALERTEFVLHYQPQIDLVTGAVIGAEALVRWNHPELGMVPPGRFIPVAEESGLIVQIGDWVLLEACRQAVAWHEAGLPEMVIAVNVSAVQFKHHKLENSVVQALVDSGLDPACLELELTESIMIHDAETVLASVQRLKALGVKLSIDDFGTGYSSLSYLKRFNVDKLKIDQSFIRDMADDPNDAAIVRAIIQMARSLNLKTIAEGVEDERLLALLRLQHCDEAQGYYFARPMPSDEFVQYAMAQIGSRRHA